MASVFRPSTSNLYFPADSSVTLRIFSLLKLPAFEILISSLELILKNKHKTVNIE